MTTPQSREAGLRPGREENNDPSYWRSDGELRHSEAFSDAMNVEFPLSADQPIGAVTRRNFLEVMGATMAFAGMTGCGRQPREAIYPYVKPPEEIIAGKPLYFASAFTMGGYASGVLVESHMGRPTKVEGLPEHPSSLGKTTVFTQASILDLYDPDRSRNLRYFGRIGMYDAFVAEMKGILDSARPKGGEGVHILTQTITSPTMVSQLEAFLAAYPKAKWHQYEPAGRESAREGARIAFGDYVDTLYRFDQADVVVSLDSDFLTTGHTQVRYAHDFAKRRDVVDEVGHAPDAADDAEPESSETSHASINLNRLYAFESAPSNTGAAADHRFPVRPSLIEAIARTLAERIGVDALASGEAGLSEEQLKWVDAVANDLEAHKGASIVIAGDHQPAIVHALAHAINHALGNVGSTVEHIEPVEARPENQTESLRSLVADMTAGNVNLLLMLGGNPVYNAPADLEFAAALDKVPVRAHLSLYEDETSEICHWHVPENHYLEAWGDARGHEGTVSIIQPLIAPLHEGKTGEEILSALLEDQGRSSHDILQSYWKSQRPGAKFDDFWAETLSQGIVEGTASKPTRPRLKRGAIDNYTPPAASKDLDITFQPDPCVGDGTFANNSWLQECPKPLTKLTWDNAVLMSYGTARRLNLDNEDMVEVSYRGRTLTGAVWKQPGHAQDTITLHLGYGRTVGGLVATGAGFNSYAIRTSDAQGVARGATLRKLGQKYSLARTEEHFTIESRGLVRHIRAEEYASDPGVVHEGFHEPGYEETLLNPEEKKWDGNAWGMTIDLNKCTGCNACIVACQSENIIPSVGKREVALGREMHWIRVDRYYHAETFKYMKEAEVEKALENPKTYYQPTPCMQCENALCEIVCPVAATQHSKEGLNEMVYNRCIGTRYCSNNCPYKVRRFNFYHYSRTPFGMDGHVYPESLKPMRNPNVTLRSRGVMEKCTYCVQRINAARIESKKQGLSMVPEGSITTACQQACASDAIEFGNINDEKSRVAALKKSHRNYSTLADTNTRPRTTYLARITNPNPELEA